MPFAVGDQWKVACSMTSGANTSASGAAFWPGQVMSNDIAETENYYNIRYAGTASRDTQQFVQGARLIAGTMRLNVQDFRWLKYALGSVLDTSGTTNLHTFIATNNNDSCPEVGGDSLPSFVLEDSNSLLVAASGLNNVRTVNGCFVNQLTLSCAEGEPLIAEVGYVGRTLTWSSGTTTSITEDTTRPYLFSDLRLDLTASGTITNFLKNVQLSINNNLQTPVYIDADRTIGTPIPTNRDYRLTATFNADSANIKPFYDQYFRGGSTFNFLFTGVVAAASRTISIAGSAAYIIEMNQPKLREGVEEFTITVAPKVLTAVESGLVFKYNPT